MGVFQYLLVPLIVIFCIVIFEIFLLSYRQRHGNHRNKDILNVNAKTAPSSLDTFVEQDLTREQLFDLNETLHALNQELNSISGLHKDIVNSHDKLIHVQDHARKISLIEKTSYTSKNGIDMNSKQTYTKEKKKKGNLKGSSSNSMDRIDRIRKSEPRAISHSSATPALIIQTQKKMKRAVLFTMDSISSYEANSKKGGASGEILIRKSLQKALGLLGVNLRTVTSDAEFETIRGGDYDIIIVDPWTWAAKGWVPKHPLIGMDKRIFILDFFGSQKLRGSGLSIPPSRFLTAFGSSWNTFLGYDMNVDHTINYDTKLQQGVIWAKDPKHFEGKCSMLLEIADELKREGSSDARLISTATRKLFIHERVQWRGHQNSESWHKLLRESKFLIGLGDPLLGPSAIDAIAAGCMYINPIYSLPKKGCLSQHPYASNNIGEPYVCNYKMDDAESLKLCIRKALQVDLKPFVPSDFKKENYLARVKNIFNI